jgi:hypothetical protein
VYLVCSDISKQSITSVFNVTDLVQMDAELMGWKTGQIVGLWTHTARSGGVGRKLGRTCIEQVRVEGTRDAE